MLESDNKIKLQIKITKLESFKVHSPEWNTSQQLSAASPMICDFQSHMSLSCIYGTKSLPF